MGVLVGGLNTARAEDKAPINIPPQQLESALYDFGGQTGLQVLFAPGLAGSKKTAGVSDETDVQVALARLLQGTGLTFRRDGDMFVIVQQGEGSSPQSAGAGGDVDALIVTAQKRAENIQDVPIAISAFTQQDLTDRQVAGGPDLITQIPNMSFTKTNFTSYSIQIRGIGTQAISATTDPAVAVAFNNTPFIRNRFFEQEFYDLERLEVLRGPQGTLYGRNATAGVVNLISAKPRFGFESRLSVDVGNYSNRRYEGMVNIPLVEDKVALRLAGAWTRRDGYATNQLTGAQIDGRDLWSGRVSLRFEPNDWISANFIYEHFQEDDDRLRSGKQLCKKHVSPTEIAGIPVDPFGFGDGGYFGGSSYLTQGCLPVSLYSEEAFQTPNGFSLPFYGPTGNLGNPVFITKDPYLHATQSRDLRVIESTVEPKYRANSDLAQFQISADLSDSLTLSSETTYSTDSLFSLQDYNRFTTTPGAWEVDAHNKSAQIAGLLSPDGVFCDPQLGCSDRLLLVDLSTSDSSQFSQEFRLGSDFDGPLNFSLGLNYLRHDAEDKYYVFINSLTLWSIQGTPIWIPGVTDQGICFGRPGAIGDTAIMKDPTQVYGINCAYIDPNTVENLNDQGRNYFLSRNPYKLISYAAFGEIYYNLTPELKLTGGLRFTVDRKQAPQVPSWLLASLTAGPYPVAQVVDQEWREPSGRLAIDWNPDLAFTEQTLLYASYAHGYKAGGANPPPPVRAYYGAGDPGEEILPDVFGPEFVDAFEVGSKNTLLGGALTLNLTGFYYDYEGYQVSEIRNRSAVNSNYDAKVWGAEIEADWRITEALRLGFKGGYNMTRIADGESNIDLMDRTAGDPNWVVLRPFPTVPSNCIIPMYVLTAGGQLHYHQTPQGSNSALVCVDTYYRNLDPVTGLPYVPNPTVLVGGSALGPDYAGYPGFDPASAPNGGRGIAKNLGGNELPNAPNYTATVTVDYTIPLAGDWQVTLHGDYHYQSESWGRVFNSDPYDRIRSFSTVNASAIITNEGGWKVMAYVKNVFDETAITGTFLNSDDTGLTTNVFLTEPRLYGLRVTRDWTGGAPWWGDGGRRHPPGEPYRLTIEVGAGTNLFGGDAEVYSPPFIGTYSPTFAFPYSVQEQDLDWGDTRDVKLTYALSDDWRVSGAYRFGRTNGAGRGASYEDIPGGAAGIGYLDKDNHAISAIHDTEEHTIVDFMVGKEIGFGVWGDGGQSSLSIGLRYAEFQSTARVVSDGITQVYTPPVVTTTTPQHFNAFTASLDSERDFEGVGPSVQWDASRRLLGDDEGGHVDFDWSVGAGVLFGKQTASNSEERFGYYQRGAAKTTLYDDAFARQRSEKVSVPNASATLGLSYAVERVKVRAGYRYDRYFDAIDGGIQAAKTYDRTIHGPYLKLSFGFGG